MPQVHDFQRGQGFSSDSAADSKQRGLSGGTKAALADGREWMALEEQRERARRRVEKDAAVEPSREVVLEAEARNMWTLSATTEGHKWGNWGFARTKGYLSHAGVLPNISPRQSQEPSPTLVETLQQGM